MLPIMTTSATDERLRRPAGIRSLQLGELTVSYVPDGAVALPARGWLPDSTDDAWAAHPEYLDPTGALVASIGALLVEHGDRALLIDAGIGPVSMSPDPSVPHGAGHGGTLLESLAELGRRPEDVEAVAITHLHSDHIGWATHGAFGEVLVAAQEWAHRDTTSTAAIAPHVRTIADGAEVFPGVLVRVRAGHTPGHTEYVISSGGQRLIAFGDALHSPIQIDHPEWSAVVDHDPVAAAEQRRRLVAELAEPDTIGFGVHFADVVFGRVRRDGDGPAWQPLS
jgi:glyoxylase-like metal-dependent hydrolase (beta-lactamase superfamily II)